MPRSVMDSGPTNYRYRLPEEADLVPGAKMVMVDLYEAPRNTGTDPAIWGTRLTLDEEPVRDEYVYYHCRNDPIQCFVPLEEFLGTVTRPTCGPDNHQWWIKE